MSERYFDNMSEKMSRSDKCGRDCKYKDDKSNKCLYETCLFEEIPPTQLSSIKSKCLLCDEEIDIPAFGFDNNRICEECMDFLKELVKNKDFFKDLMENQDTLKELMERKEDIIKLADKKTEILRLAKFKDELIDLLDDEVVRRKDELEKDDF